MKNKIFSGGSIPFTNSGETTIPSGRIISVAGIIGVVSADVLPGKTGVLEVDAGFEIPKAQVTIAKGDHLFLDTATHTVTNVPAMGKPYAGVALDPAAEGAAAVRMKLPALPAPQAANVAAIATVDGSDAGTTQALANATKAAFNDLLAKLKASGLVAADPE